MHGHTNFSNNDGYKDALNSLRALVVGAKEYGMAGIAVTDHGVLSAHPKVCRMKDADPDFFKDFKVAFGSEIYLVDREKIQYAREHNEKTKFYHFILIAKNYHGYQALRKISSEGWRQSFYFRGLRRRPSYKDYVAKVMKDYKGDVIATTACLGSELSHDILTKNRADAVQFLNYLINTFGKHDVYLELMPSDSREQITVNQNLKRISDRTGLKYEISTDSHYIDKRDQKAHENFLHADNRNRDVASYYKFAHLFSPRQLEDYFTPEIIKTAFDNSQQALNEIDQINLYRKPEIPKVPIPNFKPVDLKDYDIDWNKYPYIMDYKNSGYRADRYYLRKIFDGMKSRGLPFNNQYLSRIDRELHTIRATSDYSNQAWSNYFLTERKILDIAWQVSIVGPGRGSCGCFLLNYLLYINDVNPVKHRLFPWRFLSLSRAKTGDNPDIDTDMESAERAKIIELERGYFGQNNVINFSTFSTLAAKGTVKSGCRGYVDHGNYISYLQGANMADLLPKENHDDWTVHDALFGNKKKGRQPAKKFINAVERYKGLKNVLAHTEGKITGVSQHASGVYFSNEPITEHNAMMMTSNGREITQYDAHDSAYCSAQKVDLLTLKALDRIHEAIRLLLRDGKIKWQGSLRKTYSHYFASDKLDMTSPGMFDMLFHGDIINAFEFSTLVGRQTLAKLNPRTFDQLVAANALMRLSVDSGEQPIDKYIRYRRNIKEWYSDMKAAGLNKSEMDIMKKHLSHYYGVCYGQEILMDISMDPKITNFNMIEANKLRKSIAKKDHKLYEKEQKYFYDKGKKCGTSRAMLDYVWNNCAEPAKNYSFNLAHGTAYTIVLMVEMNIAYYYGPVYWQTACLSVNSGIFGKKFNNPDYTKLDRAMGELRDKIITPDINKSAKGFVPDSDKILFGLYPISGIGTDDCDTIIDSRPYKSFDDFLAKTKLSKRKVIQLIKSGAFSKFGSEPRKLMIKYINKIVPNKKRLTTVQIPKIERYIPKKFSKMVELYEFRRHITGRYKVPMNKILSTQFFKLYEPLISRNYGKSYSFINGKLKIDLKTFNKWYNRYIQPLKDWLKSDEAISCESRLRKRKTWIKYCMGNQQSWNMDSLGCYIGTHELELTSVGRKYRVSDLNGLPDNPKVTGWSGFRNHKFPIFEHHFIYGTVVGKNSTKSLVFLLTPNGVANVRVGKARYIKYNKKISKTLDKRRVLIKDSWFNRGTKLLCLGFKRGNDFFLNKVQTGYNSCLFRIKGYGNHAKVISC